MRTNPPHQQAIAEAGFALPVKILGACDLPVFRAEADRLLRNTDKSGVRNIFAKSSLLRDWAAAFCNGVCLRAIKSAEWQIVRGLLFAKSPNHNWSLRWHQDSALAFRREVQVPGFGPWSVKEKIPHAISPAQLLRNIVTVRLHLDDTDEENGALEILPGTHLVGRLARQQINNQVNNLRPVVCSLRAGEAMLMSPLLIHRSAKCAVARQRRVIHAEFAPGPPPAPLAWAGK